MPWVGAALKIKIISHIVSFWKSKNLFFSLIHKNQKHTTASQRRVKSRDGACDRTARTHKAAANKPCGIWLTICQFDPTRLPIVERNAGQLINAGAERFELLHALYPQNVVYWPLDAQVWDMDGPLAAIYREADSNPRTLRSIWPNYIYTVRAAYTRAYVCRHAKHIMVVCVSVGEWLFT
jgi:hypothetical protein